MSDPLSRESAFLVNNLLFVALTFTVLLGTTFPLIVEAVKDVKLSVGEPYFNRITIPIGVAILFLMGVGPSLPWGRASSARLQSHLLPPLAGTVLAVGIGWALGARTPWPMATLAAGGFSFVVTIRELIAPVTALAAASAKGRPSVGQWFAALGPAFGRSRRRMGGYTVHLGMIAIIVAVAMSSAYSFDRELRINKGDCTDFSGYELCFTGTRDKQESNRSLQIADVKVTGRGADTVVSPALVSYARMGSPIGAPDVHSTLTHDLYLSLMKVDGDSVGIHAFDKPLIIWIWLGALISVIGGLMAAIPVRGLATGSAE